jgi:acetyl esterase/lipase
VKSMRVIAYGDDAAQQGDLHLPDLVHPPIVCLLHGGFWRMPYGREQMNGLALRLVRCGFAVWNLSYRRVGAPGGGFPGTLLDVDAGIDKLAEISTEIDLDLRRLVVVGHSAGGQLALWSASRRRSSLAMVKGHVEPIAVVGLAPVSDLESAQGLQLGGGAVAKFLADGHIGFDASCRESSPRALLPLGVNQLILHGDMDSAVPLSMSQAYAAAARKTGDSLELIELLGIGHMELIDPTTIAFDELVCWLRRAVGNELTGLA